MLVRFCCIVLLCLCARLAAQSNGVPAAEIGYVPAVARLDAILMAARRDGWPPQVAPLRAAAVRAYEYENIVAAEAWFQVYAWAALFGRSEAEFISNWIDAVNAARVGHANMSRDYHGRNVPLGLSLSPELQRWLLGDRGFSAEFFALLSPVDFLPRVFAVLDTLYSANPARFKAYPALALAIAVVYDVPPPPFWPHGQVRAEALPRKHPPAIDAFNWWVKQDQLGRMAHSLRRLRADEIKFIVDAVAPAAELEWAQRMFSYPIDELPRAYTAVKYRRDRAGSEQMIWPGKTYRLADIMAAGGICADQAYFATEVGKARGVPTLLFHGSGNDGRHAWFGYLDTNRQWRLDAGRYAEQRFVTGFARDPQTWREFSDHELRFLKEHFRSLVSYKQSRVHEEFAADFLGAGVPAKAAAAARKAVNFERRNQAAWELLISAVRQQSGDAKAVEVVMREAALAFRNYPDLEAFYVARVAESLRARGQTSEAENEIRRIADKNRYARIDISTAQARDILRRAIQTEPLEAQLRAYNSVVDTFGAGAGIGFFDEIVVAFVEHLLQLQHKPEAMRALERARATLRVEPHSQLEAEFKKLQETVDRVQPARRTMGQGNVRRIPNTEPSNAP